MHPRDITPHATLPSHAPRTQRHPRRVSTNTCCPPHSLTQEKTRRVQTKAEKQARAAERAARQEKQDVMASQIDDVKQAPTHTRTQPLTYPRTYPPAQPTNIHTRTRAESRRQGPKAPEISPCAVRRFQSGNFKPLCETKWRKHTAQTENKHSMKNRIRGKHESSQA